MPQQQQQQEELDWKAILRESTWLTAVWEWLQTLLGRAVDLVLWVTMIFSCYQLIPGATQPPASVSTFMFVLQFIALDVGGMSLNRLAQQQGLDRWAYSRVIAYILIGITLITISYAGMEHAVTIDASVTNWIEVLLVIARSVMTVLYGQAIHALKVADQSLRDRLTELETLVPVLRHQLASEQQAASSLQGRLSTVQQRVSSLQEALDSRQHELDTLRHQLDTGQQQVSSLQQELDSGQEEASMLRRQLNAALVEVDTLRAQLDGKQKELESLRETLESGQEWQESRIRQLAETEQQRVDILQQQLLLEQNTTVALRRQLSAAQAHAEALQVHLEQVTRERQTLMAQVNRSEKQVSDLTLRIQEMTSSSTGQKEIKAKKSEQVSTGGSPQQGSVLRFVPRQGEGRSKHDPLTVKAWCEAHPDLTQAEQAAQLGISDAANLRRLLRRARDLKSTTGHAANNG